MNDIFSIDQSPKGARLISPGCSPGTEGTISIPRVTPRATKVHPFRVLTWEREKRVIKILILLLPLSPCRGEGTGLCLTRMKLVR